jgi:coenzyme F420-dependent glucose-6-phosphate dehydrogenase
MPLPILKKGTIGFNACPDMIDANRLLEECVLAEKSGFDAVWVSDHFHPWFHNGAFEYNSWVWMSAAMQQVNLPFGTSVTAPLFRYHPAIVAQAFATMEKLFGHRVILGVGTGEAMNEVPLGFNWPPYSERRDRLIEAVQLMRTLWKGGFVDFEGRYYKLRAANIYLRADIPIMMSALGPKMSRLVGRYGDGLVTSAKTPDYIKEVIFPNAKDGAKEAGRSFEDILKVVEIDVAYDEDYDTALKAIRKWRATTMNEIFLHSISDPREIEERGNTVSDEEMAKVFPVATNEEVFIERIEEYFDCGFDHVYLQLNSFDDNKAIDLFAKKVLPYFKDRR